MQLEERVRDDLPGQAVLVLEPAALACAVRRPGELVPVVVDLLLVLAADVEGDGLGELELRAAVERDELAGPRARTFITMTGPLGAGPASPYRLTS